MEIDPELTTMSMGAGALASTTKFAKEKPKHVGERFGPTWGNMVERAMPGGGVLSFDLSALTMQDYRSMLNHYQVNISITLLSFMVHQTNWRVKGTDDKIAKFVEDNLKDMWPRFVRATSQAYWAGYSPVVIQYKQEGKRILLDKFKDIAPEDALINYKDVNGAAGPNGIPPKIKVYDGMKIRGQHAIVPPENSFWYPLLAENGRMSGRKLLKPAFPSWFFSQIMHMFANNYFERFAEPTPIGRAPFGEPGVNAAGETVPAQVAMRETLMSLRNNGAVVLPSARTDDLNGGQTDYEYNIQYLESQMRGADFERYMSRLDEEISLGIFTPVLLYRTSDVGSYNLGEAHMQIFLIMINSLVADLAEYINRFIIRRLIDFNFGTQKGKDVRFVPYRQGDATQATLRQIATALIQGGGVKVDVEDLGLALGMDLEEQAIVAPNAGGTANEDGRPKAPPNNSAPTPPGK